MSAASPLTQYMSTGDRRGAGEWLVREFGREVVRLCQAIVRDETVAQDLAQDVFVRALTSLDGFRGEASSRTWILRIARNRCIDHLRSAVRDPWGGASVREFDPDGHYEEPALPDPSGSRIDLRAALDELTPGERALVVLRVLYGRDYAELAKEMDLGEGALRMRYARAIAKLRAALEVGVQLGCTDAGVAYGRSARFASRYEAPPTASDDSAASDLPTLLGIRPDRPMRRALSALFLDVRDEVLDRIRERLVR